MGKRLKTGSRIIKLFFIKNKIVLICFLIILIILFAVFQYNDFGTYKFETPIEYHNLFFDIKDVYGIGLCDKYISEEYWDIHSKSKIAEEYERKGAEIYPVALIDDLTLLLKKCEFKQLDRKEAFLTSRLFNRFNNITTYKISDAYFDEKLADERFSFDILQLLINEGSGVVDAGVFVISDNVYLMIDYIRLDDISSTMFDFRKNAHIEKYVFEFIESENSKEIVERKFSFYSGSYGMYKS